MVSCSVYIKDQMLLLNPIVLWLNGYNQSLDKQLPKIFDKISFQVKRAQNIVTCGIWHVLNDSYQNYSQKNLLYFTLSDISTRILDDIFPQWEKSFYCREERFY